jgi:hypothetical protein
MKAWKNFLFSTSSRPLLHVVQAGSEAHAASYPMGTGGKAAGA